MPQKTIYLPDEAAALWDEAKEKLGESMSKLVTECIRSRLTALETTPQRIVVEEFDEGRPEEFPRRKKAFMGRWIVPELAGQWPAGFGGRARREKFRYAVALTQRDRLLFHTFSKTCSMTEVFDNLEAMKASNFDDEIKKKYPQNLLWAVSDALSTELDIEELDI